MLRLTIWYYYNIDYQNTLNYKPRDPETYRTAKCTLPPPLYITEMWWLDTPLYDTSYMYNGTSQTLTTGCCWGGGLLRHRCSDCSGFGPQAVSKGGEVTPNTFTLHFMLFQSLSLKRIYGIPLEFTLTTCWLLARSQAPHRAGPQWGKLACFAPVL